MILKASRVGESYCIGGHSERTNLAVVYAICRILDELVPVGNGPHSDLITPVADRPGHDFRYAINCSKIEQELGRKPTYNFEAGLKKTIRWYLGNKEWVRSIQSGAYLDGLSFSYNKRDKEDRS